MSERPSIPQREADYEYWEDDRVIPAKFWFEEGVEAHGNMTWATYEDENGLLRTKSWHNPFYDCIQKAYRDWVVEKELLR